MTNKQIKILRYIHKSPQTWEDICNKFGIPCDSSSKLYHDAFGDDFFNYVECYKKADHFQSIIEINNLGIELLEKRNSQTLHQWMPYVFSTFALIVSIIALIKAW